MWQATLASLLSNMSSHTVPQTLLYLTSSLPACGRLFWPASRANDTKKRSVHKGNFAQRIPTYIGRFGTVGKACQHVPNKNYCRWTRVDPQKSHWRLDIKRIYSYLFIDIYITVFRYRYFTNTQQIIRVSPLFRAATSFPHAPLTTNWLSGDHPPTFPVCAYNYPPINERMTDVVPGPSCWPNSGLLYVTHSASGHHLSTVSRLAA